MANLARMHADGLGVPKDLAEALRLYKSAAEQGEFLAQIELGRIFSRGLSVTVDPHAALRRYSAAVAQQNSVGDGEDIQEAKAYIASRR